MLCYKSRNIQTILNPLTSYDCLKSQFIAHTATFKDILKIFGKLVILSQYSEYSSEIKLVEYSTGLEISKFDSILQCVNIVLHY